VPEVNEYDTNGKNGNVEEEIDNQPRIEQLVGSLWIFVVPTGSPCNARESQQVGRQEDHTDSNRGKAPDPQAKAGPDASACQCLMAGAEIPDNQSQKRNHGHNPHPQV